HGAQVGRRRQGLVDCAGLRVIVHGVNAHFQGIVHYKPADGSMTSIDAPALAPDDATRIRAMGLNVVRLPINWSALEPTETGGFDQSVMDRIAQGGDQCRAPGVGGVLDMHQDRHSENTRTHGQPAWATIPLPATRPSDASSNISQAAMAAFGTFFGDSTDGARLRQRFAAALVHLAQRWGQDDAVVGFELFNEPLGATDYQL